MMMMMMMMVVMKVVLVSGDEDFDDHPEAELLPGADHQGDNDPAGLEVSLC